MEPTNYRVVPPSRPISRQLRLFAPLGMLKKPHQQTFEEFAQSPRTWFHGSDNPTISKNYRKTGFHVGTQRAAEDRLAMRRHQEAKDDDGWEWDHYDTEVNHIHPVRIVTPKMQNYVDEPKPDRATEWGPQHHRSYYRNKFEDEGSVSAILKSPRDVRTYTEVAADAIKRGGIPSAEAEYHLERSRRTGEQPTVTPSFIPERPEHRPFAHQGFMLHGTDEPYKGVNPDFKPLPLHVNPQAAAPEHEHEASQWLPRYAAEKLSKGQFGQT